MKRTHQSYGFSNEPTSEFPDYFQSPWSDNRPIRIIGSSSSSLLPPHDFYSTEHYTGLQETCFLGGSLQARNELEYQYQPSYGPFNLSESEQLLYLRNKLLDDLDDSSRQSPSVPFDASHNLQVSRQFGRSYGYISSTFPCSNSVSSPASISSSKARIRWTPDLHDRFVECVNTLGGPEKATPKAILKLMDTDGLTIFHVKSHLQKYRNAKYTTESAEGRVERPTSSANNNNAADINIKTGMELKEALQLQLDVQRRLHEQLEIQRNLQMRIEEQGKQLKMMFDQQQKTTQSFMQTSDKFPSNSPNIHEEYLEAFVLDGLEEDDDIAFRSKIS